MSALALAASPGAARVPSSARLMTQVPASVVARATRPGSCGHGPWAGGRSPGTRRSRRRRWRGAGARAARPPPGRRTRAPPPPAPDAGPPRPTWPGRRPGRPTTSSRGGPGRSAPARPAVPGSRRPTTAPGPRMAARRAPGPRREAPLTARRHDHGPGPLDLAQVGDQVADRPVRAAGHQGVRRHPGRRRAQRGRPVLDELEHVIKHHGQQSYQAPPTARRPWRAPGAGRARAMTSAR